jgi:hypothetical protein
MTRRLGWLLWFGLLPSALSAPEDAAYGQRRIAEYAVPAATVARYARFKPNAPLPGESKIVNALLADTVEWVGPPMTVGPDQNPYRLVLRVRGQALADGDVASLWQAGWRFPLSDGGTQDRVDPVSGVTRERVRSGETQSFVAPSGGSTFREAREVQPFVGLVNLRSRSGRACRRRPRARPCCRCPHWASAS